MRIQIPTLLTASALVLTGGAVGVSLGVTGSATAASVAPSPDTGNGSADAPAERDDEHRAEHVARVRADLEPLVAAGTITGAQADAVAERLVELRPGRGGPGGHGRHGHGPGARLLTAEATASALGITVEELRAAREAGRTLAQVAEEEGVARATLIDRLVAAAETELERAVSEGRLSQAQADQVSDGLEARIAEKVDRAGPARGERRRERPAVEGTTGPSGSSTTA